MKPVRADLGKVMKLREKRLVIHGEVHRNEKDIEEYFCREGVDGNCCIVIVRGGVVGGWCEGVMPDVGFSAGYDDSI